MSNLPELTINEQSVGVLKEILRSKDKDNKGYMNIDELADCLEAFGLNPDDDDLEFLKQHMDDNGDGKLEIEEILGNMEVINYHCYYGKELMEEFKNIDQDGDGVIRFPELLRVLTTRPPNPLEPLEARRLLDMLARRFDANFDGKFSYTEFVKIYMSDSLPYRDEIESGMFVPIAPPPDTNCTKKSTKSATKTRKKTGTPASAASSRDTGRSSAVSKESKTSQAQAKTHDSTAGSTASRPKTGSKNVHLKSASRPKTGSKKI